VNAEASESRQRDADALSKSLTNPYTFGAHIAASGVPPRTIEHCRAAGDDNTTQVYAHYQPSEAEPVDAEFG
jgi:hypothetical protein